MDASRTDAPRAHLCTTRVPVRWGDMDALGHVNNTVFFRYFEQARIDALDRAFGGAWPEGGGPILAATSATFHRPVRYPATAVVRVHGGPPGRTSFAHFYELTLEEDAETVVATGEARLVWVDADGRPTPLPDALRATLPQPLPDDA
ncbi:MAG: thioesterase family protein [Rubricoccaceae bacterium]|nr:thioesterase family protein [Rubricoccaceae bacterium]